MKKKVAIFGAGITGLVAARELIRMSHEVDVYEALDHVGGLAATFRDNDGFMYDNGPRFIFSTLAEKIGIADICEPVKYYEHLYVGGRYYLFPFGFARNLRFFVSAGLATITRSFHTRPTTLGKFLEVYYGRIFSREVLKPLIEKWSGIPSHEMSVDFASRLLPTNIGYLVHSVIKRLRGGITEDYYRAGRYIVYPRGSNSKIFEKLLETPNLRVHLEAPLRMMRVEGDRVVSAETAAGSVMADHYVSTIPISKLARMIRPEHESDWTKLTYRGILILFIKLKRPKVLEGLWTWFPESQYCFYRISEFKNAIPDLAPSDKTLIAVEIACNENDPFWSSNAQTVYERVAGDLMDLYGLRRDEIIGLDLQKSPEAYPILRKSTEELTRAIHHHTPYRNLWVAGRIGMFQYIMSEGCYESAMSCVKEITRETRAQSVGALNSIERDAFGRPNRIPE